MNALAEIEAAVQQFSVTGLATLQHFVRSTRLKMLWTDGQSALDLPPSNLGRMLKPLGTREDWYDEMLGELQ